MSRVVPCLLFTRACCFLARALNREDLPTLGRPISAILKGVVAENLRADLLLAGLSLEGVSGSTGRDKRSEPRDIPMSGLRAGGGPVSRSAPLSASAWYILPETPSARGRTDVIGKFVAIVVFRSGMPWPVVAERGRRCFSPNWRNSEGGRNSFLSDLLRAMR